MRELVLNLAKVIFMLKHSVKLRRYLLCGCVAACHGMAYFTECFNINITLARFSASSPDDGRRPKKAGAIFMRILM